MYVYMIFKQKELDFKFEVESIFIIEIAHL